MHATKSAGLGVSKRQVSGVARPPFSKRLATAIPSAAMWATVFAALCAALQSLDPNGVHFQPMWILSLWAGSCLSCALSTAVFWQWDPGSPLRSINELARLHREEGNRPRIEATILWAVPRMRIQYWSRITPDARTVLAEAVQSSNDIVLCAVFAALEALSDDALVEHATRFQASDRDCASPQLCASVEHYLRHFQVLNVYSRRHLLRPSTPAHVNTVLLRQSQEPAAAELLRAASDAQGHAGRTTRAGIVPGKSAPETGAQDAQQKNTGGA